MMSPRIVLRLSAGAALAALLAFQPVTRGAAAEAAAMMSAGLNLADIDHSCKPCDDFRRFATGNWEKTHRIPPGYNGYSSSDEINDRNELALRGILDHAAADTAAGATPDERRIGVFYAACNDAAAIEKNGFAALQPEFDRINAIQNVPELVAEMSRLGRLGVDTGLDFGSEPDLRDSSRTIGAVGFGGLGMPDRDYYLAASNASIRAAYATYLTRVLGFAGDDAAEASQHMRAIVALETELAKATPPTADLRDPHATYHPTAVDRLPAIAPHVPWSAYFASMDHAHLTSVDVNLPLYLRAFDKQLAAAPLDTWKAYLRTHVITTYAAALPQRFDDASFAFYRTAINGVKAQLPRWKRCIAATDSALPDPLGKVYVAQQFPPDAKARALALVNNLQATLHDDIATLPWMSPPTRAEAEIKLAAYTKKIGYPDKWVDFSSVVLSPDASYLEDRFVTSRFAIARDLARIGKPTDRSLWGMSPPTVNAYYSPQNNEIVFPAGILQPPFFDASADDAVNYGAIGATIGHEMTHGFDDQGRQFDAHGNLRDWWTKADAAAFNERANCIVTQFNGYTVVPGTNENGKLVQGEAIADLGGAVIAFRAFQKTAEYREHKTIGGYTPEQRFFLSFAASWRSLIKPQAARNYAITDPHPADRYRVIGTLANMPEFAAAFKCAMNDPMVRKNRCRIW